MTAAIFKKVGISDGRAAGVAAALGGNLIMSFDSLFIRLSGTGGFDTIFLFGLFTALSMAVLIQLTDKRGLVRAVRDAGLPALFSGLLMLGSASTLVLSIKHNSVANTVIIMSSQPVVTAAMSWIFLRERTGIRLWLAIAAVMGGVSLVILGGLRTGNLLGDGLAVGTVLCLSANATLWRRYKGLSRMVCVGLGGLFLTLVMAFLAHPAALSLRSWLVMAPMGLLSGPLGRVLKATSTRHIPATEMSMISLSLSVFASLWAYLAFGETPGLETVLGGVVILGTIVAYFALPSRPSASPAYEPAGR